MSDFFGSKRYKALTPREKFVLYMVYIRILMYRECESVDEALEDMYCEKYGNHKPKSGYSNNIDYRVSRKLTALSERRPRLFNRVKRSGCDYYGDTNVHYYVYTMNDYQMELVEKELDGFENMEAHLEYKREKERLNEKSS